MELFENVSLKGKTTMRIGGTAAYYAELSSKEDIARATEFAAQKGVPLIPLGGGSNTIFADGEINALVVRMKNDAVQINNNAVTVGASKNLPALIFELAKEGLDLSALTGILGTVGGAVFGNAGQGPKDIWIGEYIDTTEVFVTGEWKTYTKQECAFGYRESAFKHMAQTPIIWEATLTLPSKPTNEIETEIQRLLQQRLDTQPHVKTAGSCFKAVSDTPAWQLIDNAGLRNTSAGDVHISKKHANFLINNGEGTFADAVRVVKTIEDGITEGLEVEMRFVKEDGTLEF